MHVRAYLYHSESSAERVEAVLDRLADSDEDPDLVDVADGADARREAMLALRESLRIGDNPDAIYDDEGRPAFGPGVLITEDATGRRDVHVGDEALEALDGAHSQ